ncbi:MAG: hypothetical protein AAFQ37_03300 [Bacteroidota bacterium]
MKVARYYFFLLLLCAGLATLSTTGCSRKYGCDTLQTTTVKLKKDGTPRKKSRNHLFDKRTTRRGGRK